MNGSFRRFRPWIVFLSIFIGFSALFQLALWLWQPMFHNQLVMRDGLPFLHWWPEMAYHDERGNLAKADFRRNLLVVFLTANNRFHPSQFVFPRFVQDGVAFPSQLSEDDEIEFFVPNSTNKLLVFGADGRRRDLPLAPGEAERIGKLMAIYPPPQDLADLLKRAYEESHSAECSGNLRQALATLQMEGN